MDVVREEIASLIDKARSPSDVEKRLQDWAKNTAAYNQIGDAIFVPAVMSDLAGQLMVYGHESGVVKLTDTREPTAFLDLPWNEALAEWRARGLISEDDFKRLLKDYAQRSDAARRLMLEQIQKLIMSELDHAIELGGSLRDFSRAVTDGTAALGITTNDPSYLETVFRTNVQAAYGAGRFRAMTDPVVIDARPFSQYRTVGDALVRPSHQALDGERHGTCYHSASAIWHRIAPPNGFRCRCSMVTLTADEARSLRVLGEIPHDGQPDQGFDGPPVAKLDA